MLPVAKKQMKIVRVPLSVTDDMLIGSLDLDQATLKGVKALRPGLLAKANQNILYIDEVNLLPDHLTDSILDAAASGWNIVEREGVSVAHPSRFILIGTMNPEEGELRPQLSDRFSLRISVEGIYDEQMRVEIIRRNLEFDEDPSRFLEKWYKAQEDHREQILDAKKLLSIVEVSDSLVRATALSCIQLHLDGHRPDIATIRAARTLTALEGRKTVTSEEILKVANMAVGFRTRGGGFEEPATEEEIREIFTDSLKRFQL
jgi:Mg-chelatase subunit ChlI